MRFLGYFMGVFLALILLQQLPFVGGIFRVPLLGFFLSAAIVSALVARGGEKLHQRRRFSRDARELGEVDTPQRRGKLGRLLLANGRAREAIEPLRDAHAADGDNMEWRYRLGMALLESGQADEATGVLQSAAEVDERYAYGDLLMQLGLARAASGDPEGALVAIERFEVLQGRTPKHAYHKGRVLRSLGRKEEANVCFLSLPELVRQAPQYQKAEARGYALRAFWARL